MAHLEVAPKPSRPRWIWALAILIIIALAATVFQQCSQEDKGHPALPGNTSVPGNQ